MEPGFLNGTAENLPKVDFSMVDEFYMSNLDYLSAEVRNVKTKRSTRKSYGDNAVAYVQVKRDGQVCVVRGKITPEHRIHNKNYSVILKIDEEEEKVLECNCLDCSASAGGCKHAVAFLMWVHRRSEEPSVTSQECYWRKSALSKAVKDTKIMDLQTLVNKKIPALRPKTGIFLEKVKSLDGSGGIFSFSKPPEFLNLSMYQLALTCKEDDKSITADAFIEFMKHTMTDIDCQQGELLTRDQSKSTVWYELRFGRITASKFFEVSRCQKTDGVLMETILCATKPFITAPTTRGLLLESSVLKEVEKKRNLKIRKCGLLLHKNFPVFSAHPMD